MRRVVSSSVHELLLLLVEDLLSLLQVLLDLEVVIPMLMLAPPLLEIVLLTDDLRHVHGMGGVASCGAGVLRLRRQARGRYLELVGASDSLSSSHHVDHVHTRSVGCAHGVDAWNSCGDMHDARANSWCTLHSACNDSGAHANS